MATMQKNVALFVLVAATAPAADLPDSWLLRQPDIVVRQMEFIYAGDIWTPTRSGAEPHRLPYTPEVESSLRFSPERNQIASMRNCDVLGGVERRLSWHRHYDGAVGWTPDGGKLSIHSGPWTAAPSCFPRTTAGPSHSPQCAQRTRASRPMDAASFPVPTSSRPGRNSL